MNKLLIVIAIAGLFISCDANKSSNKATDSTGVAAKVVTGNEPVISFEKESYDFGMINQGEKVSYDFKFKNTGKTPLIITDASASCGCTVPEYPHEPIAPGKESVIKVVFNSDGKVGKQNKVVTVTSNAVPSPNQVYLIGEVKDPKTK